MLSNTVGGASDCRPRGRKFESQLGHIPTMEIDHAIISTVIPTPSADSRRAVVTYWQKYVHANWLTAKRTKPAQEKCVQVKGSIFLKNSHFIIQKRLNKLIYGINTIIKRDTSQPVKFQLVSHISNSSRKHAYIILTPLNPTFI